MPMKTLLTFVAASLFAVSTFAQQPIPGLMPAPAATGSAGTTLGANTTSGAAGIDLANRVKLRGFVDFKYENLQNEKNVANNDEAGFDTSADLDFLFDFSPVTAEVQTQLSPDSNPNKKAVDLEQAFLRFNINRDFSLSFGRQLTVLGFEADEAPNLYQVSNAYLLGDVVGGGHGWRRNYVEGIRANFNNARFGFTLGLHNSLYGVDDDTKGGTVALDLQAAVMIMPGLEGRIGYAHDSNDAIAGDDSIEQINIWLSYAQGGLTTAIEYDNWEVYGDDAWNIMLMGSYQFNQLFALTLRYSHEDFEQGATDTDTDRFTLGLGFTVTDNLGLRLEYSHGSVEEGSTDYDVDEIYAEGILTF